MFGRFKRAYIPTIAMSTKSLFLLFINLTLASFSFSQQKEVKIGVELRPRFILNNGYSTPILKKDNPDSYFTQRTRMFIAFNKEKISANVSFQDVRIWGNDNLYNSRGIYGNTNSITLFAGWFKYQFSPKISIKTGRQIFCYDDQRILAKRSWNDYQVTYDALLLQWKNFDNKLDMAFSWNANNKKTSFLETTKFKLLSFLRYEKQRGNFNFSGIAVVTGNTITDSTSDIFYRGTYGLYARYKSKKNSITLSGYYQNNLNNIGKNTSAYCISVFLNRELLFNNSDISIGVDLLSGQDATKTGEYQTTNHRFDLLYGKRHGFYGYMDYYNTTPQQGLQDYYLKFNSSIKKINFGIDYHYFRLSSAVYKINTTNNLSENLGHELDFTIKTDILKIVKLQAGYSFYLVTNTLKQIKELQCQEVKFPQFFYVMVTVTPSILFDKVDF